MKTLFVHYTPLYTYTSFYHDNTLLVTEAFSSKEITKLLVATIQRNLETVNVNILEIDSICVSVGPAPAFALRSILAAVNGIKTAFLLQKKNLLLFAVDNFELLYLQYQDHQKDRFVIALYNAYANDLFYFYTHNTISYRGIYSIDTVLSEISQIQREKPVTIVGTLSDIQKEFFVMAGIFFDEHAQRSHEDFCAYSLGLLPNLESKEYLFPYYTKLHEAEKSFKTNIFSLR